MVVPATMAFNLHSRMSGTEASPFDSEVFLFVLLFSFSSPSLFLIPTMSGNNIKVVCRFRPQNKLEIREGGVPIIDISDEGSSLKFNVRLYHVYLLA